MEEKIIARVGMHTDEQTKYCHHKVQIPFIMIYQESILATKEITNFRKKVKYPVYQINLKNYSILHIETEK